MSQMRKPVMEVIRFTESDIVVASNGARRMAEPTLSLTGFSGGSPADGVASFNGEDYVMSSHTAVTSLVKALNGSGISNAGISTGGKAQSLRATLKFEVDSGARYFYDGDYVYEPSATWT